MSVFEQVDDGEYRDELLMHYCCQETADTCMSVVDDGEYRDELLMHYCCQETADTCMSDADTGISDTDITMSEIASVTLLSN